jgi:ectoine hydroxylase-related dioxygenase (phytanoyl-CoA dioxygenase family)
MSAGPIGETPHDDGAKRFSADEVARFRRAVLEDGYVVLENVVSKEKLSTLSTRMLRAFESAKQSMFSGGGALSGHLNSSPGEEARFVFDTLEQRGVIALVRELFPSATRLPNIGCNFNLPGSVAQHYHSDSAFKEAFVIVNIAVVDTDLVNGAIDLLPGTQKKFYKFWRYALERAYRRTTRVPMKQGDVLIRVSTLWHRGMPNKSVTPRPMVAFTWEHGGSNLDDPFQADDGKIVFKPNWYRPTRLGRLRERTFIAAPISYSAYRFARSLVGNKGFESY